MILVTWEFKRLSLAGCRRSKTSCGYSANVTASPGRANSRLVGARCRRSVKSALRYVTSSTAPSRCLNFLH